jgi:hypothetical protein
MTLSFDSQAKLELTRVGHAFLNNEYGSRETVWFVGKKRLTQASDTKKEHHEI